MNSFFAVPGSAQPATVGLPVGGSVKNAGRVRAPFGAQTQNDRTNARGTFAVKVNFPVSFQTRRGDAIAF